jgi:exosortase A-associated hydrolase 2
MNTQKAENVTLQPGYIDGGQGRLFTLCNLPRNKQQVVFLFLPSFAEELNRCRVMVAMQARQMVIQGYGCLLLDYYGTGDSEGDFSETSWVQWQQDLNTASQWLQQQGYQNIALWGLRTGALLAIDAAVRHPERYQRVLLWQPVLDGKQFMTQFLRIRIAMLMDRGLKKETTREMRDRLAQGQSVEVAGYEITSGLVTELERQKMLDYTVSKTMAKIDWFEVVMNEEGEIPFASQRILTAWKNKHVDYRLHTFAGPFFWQLHERELTPDLLNKTNRVLSTIE